MDKVVCIFVVRGVEVLRTEENKHPGMDKIVREWEEVLEPRLRTAQSTKVKHTGSFYWDHMDDSKAHVFIGDKSLTVQV